MKMSNYVADSNLSALKLISNKVSGKFGYAVARNIRELSSSLKEYTQAKNELIAKYGEVNGNEISLNTNSENYKNFIKDLKEYAEIEHNVDIMKIELDYVYSSSLTADLIANIMFMIKEEGADNGE